MIDKILTLILLLSGSFICIYSEIIVCSDNKNFFRWLLISIIGIILMMVGYRLGYKAFKDVWYITILCGFTIAISEPFIVYSLVKELPNKGNTIGIILAFLGMLSATFIK